MKPLTANNDDGRVLLALRAGPMTPGEIRERGLGCPSRWLLKAGYVRQDDSFYHLTAAGRAACPLRNPLAASVPAPTPFRLEIEPMSNTKITRQQVLEVIQQAGPEGISRPMLIEHFGAPNDACIGFHLQMLGKLSPPAIDRPRKGHYIARAGTVAHAPCKGGQATADEPPAAPPPVNPENAPKSQIQEAVSSTPAAREEIVETIEITAIPDRRAPLVISIGKAEELEITISSNGTMALIWEDDETSHGVIELSRPAVAKLHTFLGLFQGVV